jgi:hypothetical protein
MGWHEIEKHDHSHRDLAGLSTLLLLGRERWVCSCGSSCWRAPLLLCFTLCGSLVGTRRLGLGGFSVFSLALEIRANGSLLWGHGEEASSDREHEGKK